MAIEKKLIHFSKLSDFEIQLNAGNILDYSIVFIQDAKKIWTHGQYYDCNEGNGASDSPTFLRIGDADDEAKANFIAVANGEKSADYYICASSIQGAETNGIVSSIVYNGPSTAPISVEYTFYGTPMRGSKKTKLLKITTTLTVSTGVITTTYEDVLDAKQDTITDLEDIREGAAKGATSVQPDDISEFITVEDVATVATSGSYEDLTNKPVYITDFDVLSLHVLATNPNDGIQADKQAIVDALAANKIVLVPYEISNNVAYRGYATLVGYTEDLVYFKVITDIDEIIVETSLKQDDIYGQEVTLREWSDKQDKLISGTNIKTINGNSILGSGDIVIEGGKALTESDIADMGFTKNTGTYSKPSGGIPKSDLGSAVQTSLGKADMALSVNDARNIYATKFSILDVDNSSGIDANIFNDPNRDILYGFPSMSEHCQDVIATKNTLKTINGQSLIGTGDITISGGSSSGNSAYTEISHGTADTAFTLTPNTFHIWDEVSTLTLTLGAETSGVANEYLFQFTSGSTATTLSLPDDIKWTGGEAPTIAANKIYQISILKGLGSVLEWDNVSLIENKLTLTDGNMASGSVLTFAYPTASELTLTMRYYRSDTLIVPIGTTSITIDWFEPMAPRIISINPTSDSTYKYTM